MKNIVILIVLLLAVSCKNTSTQNNAQNNAQTDSQAFDGGADIGGSNDYMGKPMESYIVDVKDLPEYQQIIKPLLVKIEQKLPRLSKLIYPSIQNRTWYLLPGPLKHISNVTIAVPSANSTDQFALHSQKAVWISEEKRAQYLSENNMNGLATHILHEIIMAVKVDGNLRIRKIIDSEFLSPKDYDEIRSLVHILMNEFDTYTSEELNAFLTENEFYNSNKTLSLIQIHPMQKTPLGDLLSDRDDVAIEAIYVYASQNKNKKSLIIDNNIAGNPHPTTYEPDSGPQANFCVYELDFLNKLSLRTYNSSGKPLVNSKSGRPDQWDGSKSIEFKENIKYKKFANGRASIKFIGEKQIINGEEQAELAHINLYNDEVIFIEIYNAVKKDSVWKPTGIQDFYIFCLNRQ